MSELSFDEIEKVAKKFSKRCTVYDFKPNNFVTIATDEGYYANIPSAFIVKYGDYFFIIAEHHDPMVFHESDIETLYQYEIITHQHDVKHIDDFFGLS